MCNIAQPQVKAELKILFSGSAIEQGQTPKLPYLLVVPSGLASTMFTVMELDFSEMPNALLRTWSPEPDSGQASGS
jgi:hypothetical protein